MDVIGTLATRAAESSFNVAVVSIDKDFFQLVTADPAVASSASAIRVYDPREEGTWFDAAGVVDVVVGEDDAAEGQIARVLRVFGREDALHLLM